MSDKSESFPMLHKTIHVAKNPVFLFPILLVIAIAYGYYGALSHAQRSDQWWYFLNTLEYKGFLNTFLNTYSYNRTVTMAQGDTTFFRPLLFMLLSAQKSFFGTQFYLYQALGIFLHYINCILMFLILRQIRNLLLSTNNHAQNTTLLKPLNFLYALLTYLLPLLFAVNLNILDAVIWTHINGYLIFYGLTLAAIGFSLHWLDSYKGLQTSNTLIAITWCIVLVSTFTYEYGQYYAPLFGFFFAVNLIKKAGLKQAVLVCCAFLVITLTYKTVNHIDMKSYPVAIIEDRENEAIYTEVLANLTKSKTWLNAYMFTKYVTFEPFFPNEPTVELKEERLFLSQVSIGNMMQGNASQRIGLLGGLLWFAIIVSAATTLLKQRDPRILSTVFLITVFLALYVTGIVAIRMNVRPGQMISSSYSVYWPFMLSLILSYIAIGASLIPLLKKSARFQQTTTIIGVLLISWLVITGVNSARRLHDTNLDLAITQNDNHELLSQVRNFVSLHKHEPDFSIAFDVERSNSIESPFGMGVPITTLLFRQYEDTFEPTYVLTWSDSTLTAVSGDEFANRYPVDSGPVVPQLVTFSQELLVYRFGDTYWGMQRFDGPYLPSRNDYRAIVQGDSVEAVLAQEEALLEKLNTLPQ